MKLENIPDFAKPYKKKGFDVRCKKGVYHLYRISSKRVEGKSYPVLQQEYIGIINPDGSLIEKKRYVDESNKNKERVYLEFGLSDFLYSKYKRTLTRSLFNITGEKASSIIALSIVQYVFSSISDTAIECCYLSKGKEEKMIEERDGGMQSKRIERLVKKIEEHQKLYFGDSLKDFETLMKLCVIERDSANKPAYPEKAMAIIEERGINL